MVVTEYEYELLKESPPFFSPTVAVYDPMTVQVSLLRQYNLQQSLKVNDFFHCKRKSCKVGLQGIWSRIRSEKECKIQGYR